MSRIEELIKSASLKPSVIVHLGAGSCGEHDLYMSLNPNRIIYVEPDQYFAEVAIDSFATTSQVKVISCAIAARNGQRTLNISNNRRFNSLLLPGELLDFYPNIEVQDKVKVKAITVDSLCKDEDLGDESDNLLVAELQGMEKEVFISANDETLQKFKWIIIRSSSTNLYKPVSKKAKGSISPVMEDANFSVLVLEDEASPFVNYLFTRNDAAIDNKRLKSQEAKLVGTIEDLEQSEAKRKVELLSLISNHDKEVAKTGRFLAAKSEKLSEARVLIKKLTREKVNQQKKLEELSTAFDTKSAVLAECREQIRTIKAESREQIHSIKAESREQIRSINVEKRDQQKQILELSKASVVSSDESALAHEQIQLISNEKDDLIQNINELSSKLDGKSAELAKALKQTESFSIEQADVRQKINELSGAVNDKSDELASSLTQIQTLTKEKENQLQKINELIDSVKEKENNLTEMQQTLRISNKLNLKSNMDLQDLQLQYRANLQNQEQQHQLLCELKEKLHQASEFYRKLNLQNLVLDTDLLEQSDSDLSLSASDQKD